VEHSESLSVMGASYAAFIAFAKEKGIAVDFRIGDKTGGVGFIYTERGRVAWSIDDGEIGFMSTLQEAEKNDCATALSLYATAMNMTINPGAENRAGDDTLVRSARRSSL